jgi:hypothetical protein
MFSQQIINSDAFLDMPLSAQALYLHLGMSADDDGFINNAKSIRRQIGASEDDLKLLIAKRFLILFDDGVCVIKHWNVNNLIRKDRRGRTTYKDKLKCLDIDETGNYHLSENGCLPAFAEKSGQMTDIVRQNPSHDGQMTSNVCLSESVIVSEDKKRESEEKKSRSRFTPPTPQQVRDYASEKDLAIDADRFCDFYASKGWKVGSSSMKDWQAAARNWAARDRKGGADAKAADRAARAAKYAAYG